MNDFAAYEQATRNSVRSDRVLPAEGLILQFCAICRRQLVGDGQCERVGVGTRLILRRLVNGLKFHSVERHGIAAGYQNNRGIVNRCWSSCKAKYSQ